MPKTNHLPCPFCGKKPKVCSLGYKSGGQWYDWVSVGCDAGPNGGCGCHQAAETKKEAWRRWDTRYAPNDKLCREQGGKDSNDR